MRQSDKTIVLWVVLIVVFIAIYQVLSVPAGQRTGPAALQKVWPELAAFVERAPAA
ncbi:MAG: hypothetical protein QM723_40725 [Myxococcaceae bacterium]